MRRLLAALVLLSASVLPAPVFADDGGSYALPAEQTCRTHTDSYNPGKTQTGFSAEATDGCHRVSWTGSIGQGPGRGMLTFETIGNVDPWTISAFPSPAGGASSYCAYRAAHEANLYFTNLFKTPPGTMVTVRYSCE